MSGHCTRTSNNRLMYYINNKRVTKAEFYKQFPNFREEDCQTKEQRQNALLNVGQKVSDIKRDQTELLQECRTQLTTCNHRVAELEGIIANNAKIVLQQQKQAEEVCKKELERIGEELKKKATSEVRKRLDALRKKVTTQFNTIKTENTALQEQLRQYLEEKKERQEELDRLRRLSTDCEERHREALRELDNRKMTESEKTRVEQELSRLRDEFNTLTSFKDQLMADCREQISEKDKLLESMKADVERKVQEFAKELASLQERVQTSNVSLSKCQEEKSELDSLLKQLSKKNEDLENRFEMLTSEHAQTLKEIREKDASISKLNDDADKWREDIRNYLGENKRMEGLVEQYQKQIDDITRDSELKNRSIREELEGKIKEMMDEMSNERAKMIQQNEQIKTDFQTIIVTKDTRISELEKMVQTLEKDCESRKAELEQKIREFEQTIDGLRQRDLSNENTINDLQTKIEAISQQLSTSSGENNRLLTELESLKQDLVEKDVSISKLKEVGEKAREEMTKVNENLLEKIQLLENNVASLTQKDLSNSQTIQELNATIETIRSELDSQKENSLKTISELQTNLTKMTSENERLLREMKESGDLHVENIEKANRKLAEVENIRKQLETQLSDLQSSFTTEKQEFESEKSRLMNEAKQQIDKANQELSEIRNQVVVLQQQLESEKEQSREKDANIIRLREELDNDRKKSEGEFKKLTDVNDDLLRKLDECKNGRADIERVKEGLVAQQEALQTSFNMIEKKLKDTSELLEKCNIDKDQYASEEKKCQQELQTFFNNFSVLNTKLFEQIEALGKSYTIDDDMDPKIKSYIRKLTRNIQETEEGKQLKYLNQYNDRISQLLEDFYDIEKSPTQLRTEEKASQIVSKKSTKSKIEEEQKMIEKTKENLKSKINKEIKNSEEKRNEIDRKIDTIKSDIRKANETVTKNKERIDENNQKLVKNNQIIEQNTPNIERLSKQVNVTSGDKLKEVKKELKILTDENDRLKKENKTITPENTKNQEKIDNANQKIEELKANKSALENERSNIEKRLEKSQSVLQTLETKNLTMDELSQMETISLSFGKRRKRSSERMQRKAKKSPRTSLRHPRALRKVKNKY